MSPPTNATIPTTPHADEANTLATDSAVTDQTATVVELSETPHTASAEEEAPAKNSSSAPTRGDRWRKRLPIVLFVLLLISVFINISQTRQQRTLAARSGELGMALDRAMTRIDEETIRADQAESSLSEVDRSVDNVQERIADLQSALSALSKATSP